MTLVDAGSSLTEYTKLFAAIKAGKQPEVAQVEYEFLPEFLSQGALDNIAADVPSGFGRDYAPWAWSEVSSGSAIYSIPQDAGPMVMYYRSDLFAKYRLSVPTTWAEYAADAVTLHKDDPSLYITDFPQDVSPFLGLMWENGAAWFGTKGNSWTVDIDGMRSTSVASYWQNLLGKGLVKTDEDFSAAWYKDLTGSSVATILSASWANSQFPDNAPAESGDWRVALLPQWPDQTSSGAWGGSTGRRHQGHTRRRRRRRSHVLGVAELQLSQLEPAHNQERDVPRLLPALEEPLPRRPRQVLRQSGHRQRRSPRPTRRSTPLGCGARPCRRSSPNGTTCSAPLSTKRRRCRPG